MPVAAVIYPVVLAVPGPAQGLPPAERVRALSRLARDALRLSADRLGVALGALEKDRRGAPRASGGHFWSLTHKPLYVGAVVAPTAVGIDIEKVRPVTAALYRRTAGEPEWALWDGGDRLAWFFRVWTAKEAVLKTRGEGIRDLPLCRISRVPDATRLEAEYTGETWPVAQVFFDGHVASVAARGLRAQWVFET
jgi:4'-phosphopantetheinyl transferase